MRGIIRLIRVNVDQSKPGEMSKARGKATIFSISSLFVTWVRVRVRVRGMVRVRVRVSVRVMPMVMVMVMDTCYSKGKGASLVFLRLVS